tara:strand:- start:24348 stop:24719 length:372 start_codon:yes stop_codon:yes gene_type:complete
MTQDINYIKEILKNCEEVDGPFDIKVGDTVRFITINNGSEYFYDGGKYVRMGDNKILLKGNKNIWVPITIINSEGEILYKSRFFVEGGGYSGGGSFVEYEKVIKNQQKIIEVLVKKINKLEGK